MSPASRSRLRPSRSDGELFSLSEAVTGDAGVIVRVGAELEGQIHGLSRSELERRLLEMGFVEGARIKVLHEGLIGRDPIAVKLDDMRVALRRSDARDIILRSGPISAGHLNG